MSIKQRLRNWVLLLTVGAIYSAPLEMDRIYFPGENPEREVEHSLYKPNLKSQQHQQPHLEMGRETSSLLEYPGSYKEPEDVISSPQQHSSGERDNHHLHQAFRPAQLTPLSDNIEEKQQERGIFHGEASQNTPSKYINQPSMQWDGADIPAQGGPHHETSHTSHKIVTHTWSSQHTARRPGHTWQDPELLMQGQDQDPSVLTETGHAGYHASHNVSINPTDLLSILNQPSAKGSDLHPTIKQAFSNVLSDLEDSPRKQVQKPSFHKVQKISHAKKIRIQNVGQEPTQIQSFSGNDNINLSQLMEQLHLLEESPGHTNITWCEKKIKEFLQALRRKQASGVFINQQVQEETLHQILTHEKNVESETSDGVYEPEVTRVTVRPLGEYHGTLKTTSHSLHDEHEKIIAEHPLGLPNSLSEQNSFHLESHKTVTHKTLQEPDTITVIPEQAFGSYLNVMSQHSQQHESLQEAPPFTSEGSEQLGTEKLEMELPEYFGEHKKEIPTRNIIEENTDTLKTNKKNEAEFLPAQPLSTQSDLQTSYDLEQGENIFHHNPNTPDGFQERPLGDLDLKLPEYPIRDDHGSPESDLRQESTVLGGPVPQMEVDNLPVHSKEDYFTRDESEEHKPQPIKDGVSTSQNFQITGNNDKLPELYELHKQQINYDTLIEELIQLESLPGHQAIDKCEEKIQEFLEILKYQQEKGFGRNQKELELLHQTLIEQAESRRKELKADTEDATSSPHSFWRQVQKKIKKTYKDAKDRVKTVLG